MPGLGEASGSSPFAILKRAICSELRQSKRDLAFLLPRRGGACTVKLKQLLVLGLGGELLGVQDGGVEVRHGEWFGRAGLFLVLVLVFLLVVSFWRNVRSCWVF